MPVLPYHRYIGPGNKLRNGKPVDEDDLIAQIHDHQYNDAKDRSDIDSADKDAIKHFFEDFISTGNVHSGIGAAGLSVKQFYEGLVGPTYPNTPPKQGIPPQMPGQPQKRKDQFVRRAFAKRRAGESAGPSDEHNDAFIEEPEEGAGEDPAMDLPQPEVDIPEAADASGSGRSGGNAAGGRGGANANALVFYGDSFLEPRRITFQHRRILSIAPWVVQTFQVMADRVFQQELFTGHAVIPVDRLYWYMSQAEWDTIPKNTWVKKVYTKATSMGQRLSFRTNQTGSSTANSQCTTFASYAIGLNMVAPCRYVNVSETDAAEPMVPLQYTATNLKSWVHRLWSPAVDTTNEIGTAFGAVRYAPDYLVMGIANGYPNGQYATNPLEINKFEKVYHVENTEGKVITDYTYKPRVSHLKTAENSLASFANRAATDSEMFATFDGKTDGNFRVSKFGQEYWTNYRNEHRQIRIPTGAQTADYLEQIEQCAWRDTDYRSNHMGHVQPSFTIQYKPIQQNVVNDGAASWASGNYFVNFDTEIDIIWDQNSYNTQIQMRREMDPIQQMSMNASTNAAVRLGTEYTTDDSVTAPYMMRGQRAARFRWTTTGGQNQFNYGTPQYQNSPGGVYENTRSGANKPPPTEATPPVPPTPKKKRTV